MGDGSCSRGCGFKSRRHILDGYFSHWFVVKIVLLAWKDRKYIIKSGRGWSILFQKKHFLFSQSRSQCHKQILEKHCCAMPKDCTPIACSKSYDFFKPIRVYCSSETQLCYSKICLWHWLRANLNGIRWLECKSFCSEVLQIGLAYSDRCKNII